MRELKFRAWDKDYKEMLQVSRLFIDEKSYIWGAGILDEHNDFHKIEHVIVMQYTGLKDRSGTEIYEGDILEMLCKNETLINGAVFYKEDIGMYLVDNYDDHLEDTLFICVNHRSARVVGHKYES